MKSLERVYIYIYVPAHSYMYVYIYIYMYMYMYCEQVKACMECLLSASAACCFPLHV